MCITALKWGATGLEGTPMGYSDGRRVGARQCEWAYFPNSKCCLSSEKMRKRKGVLASWSVTERKIAVRVWWRHLNMGSRMPWISWLIWCLFFGMWPSASNLMFSELDFSDLKNGVAVWCDMQNWSEPNKCSVDVRIVLNYYGLCIEIFMFCQINTQRTSQQPFLPLPPPLLSFLPSLVLTSWAPKVGRSK